MQNVQSPVPLAPQSMEASIALECPSTPGPADERRRSSGESEAFPGRDQGSPPGTPPDRRIRHYRDFWPFYLSEHSKPLTRALHCLGTASSLVLFGVGLIVADWRLLAGAVVIGYLLVWISHAVVERNWPATFKHPFWSLASDFRMLALVLTGRLDAELEKHRIDRP